VNPVASGAMEVRVTGCPGVIQPWEALWVALGGQAGLSCLGEQVREAGVPCRARKTRSLVGGGAGIEIPHDRK
jgi:hypothetical protein